MGTEPLTRPTIPKLFFNRNTTKHINNTNNALRDLKEHVSTITDVHTALYAAAVTLIEFNGQKLLENKHNNKTTLPESAWRRRIENTIKNIRTKINVITEHLNNNISKKVQTKINIIFHKARINPRHNNATQELRA